MTLRLKEGFKSSSRWLSIRTEIGNWNVGFLTLKPRVLQFQEWPAFLKSWARAMAKLPFSGNCSWKRWHGLSTHPYIEENTANSWGSWDIKNLKKKIKAHGLYRDIMRPPPKPTFWELGKCEIREGRKMCLSSSKQFLLLFKSSLLSVN